jgi:protoporphyrinogen oxidase
MKEWLDVSFGRTLCGLFFHPFHERYTAKLYDRIAPQDPYKSPVPIRTVIQGARTVTRPAGYNASFFYPKNGLNTLMRNMAKQCDVRYGYEAVKIDVKNRTVHFSNGKNAAYHTLLSTLPLDKMMKMTGLTTREKPAPYTSVLVLNIGAVRGSQCPEDHWLYVPDALSGFYRVGFYSNVDASFLPRSARREKNRAGVYVERAFPGGVRSRPADTNRYILEVVRELQEWGWIGNPEVLDPTWIDTAYTWSWPGSRWRENALKKLAVHSICQIGRYGRWQFQGIAESIWEGLRLRPQRLSE